MSILMPVFNAARTLPTTLRSIALQTFSDWELIVIDDGSRDATLAVASRFGDPRVRVVDGQGNRGLASRLNQAIQLARGELLARMDGDDIAYPDRLARQVAYLKDHPGCDLVGCAAVVFNDAGAITGKLEAPPSHEEICRRPWSGFPLPHPTWLGRRRWFERYLYDGTFRKAEDFEILLRAHHDSRFSAVDGILLGYRQDRRTLKKLLGGRFHTARAIFLEGRRLGEWGTCARGIAGQVAKSVVDALTVPVGMDNFVRHESEREISQSDRLEWDRVWRLVSESSQG